MTLPEAGTLIDLHTLLLLYAPDGVLGTTSAVGSIPGWPGSSRCCLSGRPFLAWQMTASALLSSLLANDIICLAFAPVIARACLTAGISMPHLLGLAMAANIGSAATLIGNPQNMLIGQLGRLEFADYLAWSLIPTLVSLAGAWVILRLLYRSVLDRRPDPNGTASITVADTDQPFDAWQTGRV